MNELKSILSQMCDNYELGFITSHEFLMQYMDILRMFGAHKCLEDKMSEMLNDLASGIVCMLRDENKGNNMIEFFGKLWQKPENN